MNIKDDRFMKFILDSGLIDAPSSGIHYTWRNNLHQSRIDRFLVNGMWLGSFAKLSQKSLLKSLSNHTPISLSTLDFIRK